MRRKKPVVDVRFRGQSGRSVAFFGSAISECLLFPKADVQITKYRVKLRSAYGQKRPFVLLGKSLSISHLIEFERLEAVALGAISPQGRVL